MSLISSKLNSIGWKPLFVFFGGGGWGTYMDTSALFVSNFLEDGRNIDLVVQGSFNRIKKYNFFISPPPFLKIRIYRPKK